MSGSHAGVGRDSIRINGPSKVEACAAAAFGGFVAALADLVSTIDDTSKSLVLKLSTVLVQWMFVPISARGIGAMPAQLITDLKLPCGNELAGALPTWPPHEVIGSDLELVTGLGREAQDMLASVGLDGDYLGHPTSV